MANSKGKSGKTTSKKRQSKVAIPSENETAEGGEVALKSDRLDDFLFNAANYIYVRRKLFITLAVVSIVLILSIWGTFKYISYQDNLRNEELFKIEQIIYNRELSDEQKSAQANPLLESFLKNHAGSSQYNIALFYRAGLNSRQKIYPQAEADLNELLSILEPETDLYFLASLYLSNVYRDQGKFDEAFELLQSAKTEAVADIILMEQAELYISNNQQDKAKELLQILLKDYPNSFYINKARQLLEIL